MNFVPLLNIKVSVKLYFLRFEYICIYMYFIFTYIHISIWFSINLFLVYKLFLFKNLSWQYYVSKYKIYIKILNGSKVMFLCYN